jgi:hypothetical protein
MAQCPPWQRSQLQKMLDLFPLLRARSWVEKRKDYNWILSASNHTDVGDSTRQQTHNWKTRLLARSSCVSPNDPAEPEAEFRSTPRLVRGSCPSSPPPQFPSLPGGSGPPWTHYCAEPGLSEPLCFDSGAGEKVVRPRDVGLRRVAAVQLCMPLQKVFS